MPRHAFAPGPKPTLVEIDRDTVEYTRDEQIALWSRTFLALPTFEFMVGASAREGMLPTTLRRLTIRNVDRGIFVNEPLTRAVRSMLLQRDGTKATDLLAEIAARTRESPDDHAIRLRSTATALPGAANGLTRSPGALPITRHHRDDE